MEKQKRYSIKEISALLDLPKATIRYWDQEGLIAPLRNTRNGYREFTLAEAMDLSNISFYRSIDIPMKEIRQMLHSPIGMQKDLLQAAGGRLLVKQQQLKQQADRIQMQLQALSELQRLREHPFGTSEPVFFAVTSFCEEKEAHWKRLIEKPGSFALVFAEGDDFDYQYGIGYEACEEPPADEKLLWRSNKRDYVEDLLIADNRDERKNNLSGRRRLLWEQGRKSQAVIAQYLTSGTGERGELLDYYRMWIECEDVL